MFSFFKTIYAATGAHRAKQAQEQSWQPVLQTPVNDDNPEEKYHHKFFGRSEDEQAV